MELTIETLSVFFAGFFLGVSVLGSVWFAVLSAAIILCWCAWYAAREWLG